MKSTPFKSLKSACVWGLPALTLVALTAVFVSMQHDIPAGPSGETTTFAASGKLAGSVQKVSCAPGSKGTCSEAHEYQTSSFSGDGHDLFLGHAWKFPVDEEIAGMFFPHECNPNSHDPTDVACLHQGSIVCRQNGEWANVATGFRFKIEARDREYCRVYFPAHAINDSFNFFRCNFHIYDAESALYSADNCSTMSKIGCLAYFDLRNLQNPDDKKSQHIDSIRNRSGDIAYFESPDASLCGSAPSFSKADFETISDLDGIKSTCDLGVAVCGAFTGGAAGYKGCTVRSVEDLEQNGVYYLREGGLNEPMVAMYQANFLGASGSGHYCLRSSGSPIPFLMSTGMISRYLTKQGTDYQDDKAQIYKGDKSRHDFNLGSSVLPTVP
ncbi:MAG: hypothetical protein RLO80_12235 [Hyphomonas sp.]